MVAVRSFLAVALGFLAVSVTAIDDRVLAEIPTQAQTCIIYEAACHSYVIKLAAYISNSDITTICEPGTSIGGTADEVAVTCSYTLKGKTTNVTSKVISHAHLVASA